jgi:tRNA-dihydrouridine synthase B
LINALTLNKTIFPTNLIQGPLAGISCAPFRRLIWKYSKPAFTCTEMISCKTIIHQPETALKRFVTIAPDEGPVCFQLSANNPAELAEATKRVTAYGAHLIDLNCGCPVNKIRGKGAGSSLLTDPSKLFQLITAMKQNTHVPVSIKIRVDGKSHDQFNLQVAQAVSDAGADFLTVHGRHWTEHYETPCRHDEIKFFVEQVKIPVIGNGDIACIRSLKEMFATGCAGVMIARAGVGQPWLIGKLTAELQQVSFSLPSLSEIGHVFLEHVAQLRTLLDSEKFAILQARKFAKYYGRDLKDRTHFTEEINLCETLQQLEIICLRYFI